MSNEGTIITEEQYQSALSIIRQYKNQLLSRLDEMKHILEDKNDPKIDNLFYDSKISLRLYNAIGKLRKYNINVPSDQSEIRVSHLKSIKPEHLYKIRGVGVKAVAEYEEFRSEYIF